VPEPTDYTYDEAEEAEIADRDADKRRDADSST